MKNINIKSIAFFCTGAIILTACSENAWNDHLDGFEVPPVYSATETISYTLTAADYSAIASNSENKALAEKDGEEDALAAIGTNAAFASAEQARKYIPALLSSTTLPYYALNNGSSVKIQYDLATNQPEEVKAINAGVRTYTVTESDYQQAWGSDDDFIKAFAPVTPASASLPGLLETAFPDASDGEYAVISYEESATNPVFGNTGGGVKEPQVYIEAPFAEGQDDFTIEDVLLPEGATYIWSFAQNYGMKASGYVGGANLDAESWLISPAVTLGEEANAVLTFDQATNFFKDVETAAKEATVNVRVEGGQWENLTVPTMPSTMSWSFVASGDIDLSAYNGKTIQIGFCYKSTAEKAGTWEVKNVKLMDGGATRSAMRAAAAPVVTESRNAIYQFDGEKWSVPGSMIILNPADYAEMGLSYGNMSGSQPAQYLPTFLSQHLPYAAEETAEIVVYRYYANPTPAWHASQLTLLEGEWVMNNGATVDQFTRKDNVWNFNPSVEITLPYSRNTDPSYTYYMACADWVFENVTKKLYPDATPANGSTPGPPFIDYRGNAEFYSGTSAYYGNVDVRATTATGNAPSGYTGYEGLSDEEVTALVKKRFCTETMKGALSVLHSDAEVVEGMDVTYTITFTAYNGTATEETIVYKVVGKGQFEYVSCTWFENGEDADWK